MSLNHETASMQQSIDGFLKCRSEWNESVASQIAKRETLTLTDKHWDIIRFLRGEFYANNGYVPLAQEARKGMERLWKRDVSYSELAELFPEGVSKQGAKIAGCITLQTVQDLLTVKGDTVWFIEPDQGVIDALRIMSEKNIGALMVVEHGRLVGIMSERDYTRNVTLKDRSSKTAKVKDIMSENVFTVAPDQTLDHCMALMTEEGFRHLPVVKDGQLVGVLSMPDLVRIIVQQQQFTISQLENREEQHDL